MNISYPRKNGIKYFQDNTVYLKADDNTVTKYMTDIYPNYVLDSYISETDQRFSNDGQLLYTFYGPITRVIDKSGHTSTTNEWQEEYGFEKIITSMKILSKVSISSGLTTIITEDTQINYTGISGSSTTVIIEGYTYIISNYNGNLIWDFGGLGEYNFGSGTTGTINVNINNNLYTITFTRGSLLVNIVNNGAISTNIPTETDRLFHLDGTILYDNSNYYFVDRTNNGRNFIINNYDFDLTWTMGFPYKSISTISAPSGDTLLISRDINNFFYSTGGTPNTIPVISLFPDVDYKHRLFCKHSPQILNSDGVETYEPRILDIVFYNTVKTSDDLISCQNYYSVPNIDINAKWIDPVSGVDATGNGSQSLPYKTHAKVDSLTLSEGTVIYCLTGTILPFNWNKNYSLKAIGFTKIQNVSGTRAIDYATAGTLSQSIQGYICDMNSVASSTCFTGNPGHQLTFSRMYFTKYILNSINTTTTSSTLNITLKNCIFTENKPGIVTARNITIDTCCVRNATNFIDSNALGPNKHIIKNSYLSGITISSIKQWVPFSVDFFGNKYINNNEIILLAHAAATSGTHKIYNNTFTSNLNYKLYEFERSGYNIEFYNNICNYIEFSGTGTYFIKLEGSSHLIYNNIIDTKKANCALGILNGLSHTKTVTIRRNKIINRNITAGYVVVVGNESLTVNNGKITSATIEQNSIIGPAKYSGGTYGTHGLMIGFIKDLYVKHNYITGNGLDIAVKGTLFSNSYVKYNVFSEAVKPMVIVSSAPLLVYGNTCYNTSSVINTQNAIRFASQPTPGGVTCTGSTLKNNIFYNDDYVTALESSDSTTFTMDYNIYKPLSQFLLNSVQISFDQFKSLGNESSGREETITFDSNLIPIIPLLGGEDLGESFNDGLDISTNWGIDSELPTVVTKQQGSNWNIGAYIN